MNKWVSEHDTYGRDPRTAPRLNDVATSRLLCSSLIDGGERFGFKGKGKAGYVRKAGECAEHCFLLLLLLLLLIQSMRPVLHNRITK